VKPPVSHLAAALIPPFGGFYSAFDASGATDHDALLERAECSQHGLSKGS
jgi:hypothetical protein